MPRQPSQIDVDFGQRLRGARLAAGLSQAALGKALGVSFQQIQKYEKGANRAGASAITTMAKALRTTPAALLGASAVEQANPHALPLLATSEGRLLAKSFCAIANPISRKIILDLALSSARADATLRRQAAE